MKATNVRRLCEDSTFVRSCLRDIAPDVDPKKMDDIVFKVHQLCHGAPKLRVLLKNLRDQVIRDKEKALIVCQLPAVSVYLLEVLKILDIKAEAYAAFQSMEEKQSIIDRFNTPGSVLRVLIIPYALAGFGLNLQKDCWRIHAIECAWNLAALEQAIGRIRRLGNPQPIVYVYEYIVPGTFDDKAIQRNIEKAIPQAMAELNRQIFFGKDTDDGTGSVDVGDWVSHEGQLWRYEEAREKFGRHFPVLSAVDLLREILLGAKGQRIQA
ncbi:MAG: hypothetical protein LQ341_007121 [Variospora aurantia]|nr:MAG: hypothetical protein LQ341_007121 [Variospora aurantia]